MNRADLEFATLAVATVVAWFFFYLSATKCWGSWHCLGV